MGLYLTIASLVFLLHPFFQGLFRTDGEMVYQGHDIYFMTGFFCFYVLSAMLNGFNARTEKLNILDNIGQNKTFLYVMGLIAVVQVLMTLIGGSILRTAPLTFNEWGVVILLSLIVLPVGTLRKLIFPEKAA